MRSVQDSENLSLPSTFEQSFQYRVARPLVTYTTPLYTSRRDSIIGEFSSAQYAALSLATPLSGLGESITQTMVRSLVGDEL